MAQKQDQRKPGPRCCSEEAKEKKKVKFAARTKTSTPEESYSVKANIGGSIRQAKLKSVTIDKRRARFTETLLPGSRSVDEDKDGFYDTESAMY